eukprot:scaffold9369_cov182-Amphora_coffeaeformis.AAC.3
MKVIPVSTDPSFWRRISETVQQFCMKNLYWPELEPYSCLFEWDCYWLGGCCHLHVVGPAIREACVYCILTIQKNLRERKLSETRITYRSTGNCFRSIVVIIARHPF